MAAIYSKSVTHTFGLNSIIMYSGSLLAKIGIIIYILDFKKCTVVHLLPLGHVVSVR